MSPPPLFFFFPALRLRCYPLLEFSRPQFLLSLVPCFQEALGEGWAEQEHGGEGTDQEHGGEERQGGEDELNDGGVQEGEDKPTSEYLGDEEPYRAGAPLFVLSWDPLFARHAVEDYVSHCCRTVLFYRILCWLYVLLKSAPCDEKWQLRW